MARPYDLTSKETSVLSRLFSLQTNVSQRSHALASTTNNRRSLVDSYTDVRQQRECWIKILSI